MYAQDGVGSGSESSASASSSAGSGSEAAPAGGQVIPGANGPNAGFAGPYGGVPGINNNYGGQQQLATTPVILIPVGFATLPSLPYPTGQIAGAPPAYAPYPYPPAYGNRIRRGVRSSRRDQLGRDPVSSRYLPGYDPYRPALPAYPYDPYYPDPYYPAPVPGSYYPANPYYPNEYYEPYPAIYPQPYRPGYARGRTVDDVL